MEKNQLIKWDGIIYRILAVEEENVLLIDCIKKTMPKWYGLDEISEYEVCPEGELGKETGREEERDLKPREKAWHIKGSLLLLGYCHFWMMTR